MKKLVLVLLMALVASIAFADFRLGAIGMYNGDFSDMKSTQISDFTFGAEAKLNLSIFQLSTDLLVYPQADGNFSFLGLADAGVAFKLAIFRLGLGLGPNFVFSLTDSASAMVGLNLRPSFDVEIGNLSIGIVGLYYLESFKDFANLGEIFSELPWLGLTATVKLF